MLEDSEASGPSPAAAPEAVEALLARCIDAVDGGDRSAVDRLLAEQPEHAARVRRLLDSLDDMGLVEPDSQQQPFTERLGDYRLLRRLGEGAMGVVFLARQESLQRIVALKVIRPGFAAIGPGIERFRREALAIAKLRHPHVVTVHDAGEDQGLWYFAMDWLPGRSLDEVPVQDLSIEQAITWGVQIAEALDCAHRAGIVHRDVKPSNIRITDDHRAVLLDFGIARDQAQDTVTLTGSFQGSPNFASPEQISTRRGVIGPRTDVFSLGATLYSCLGGALPFSGETQEQVFHQVLTVDPVPLRRINGRVSRNLETIIHTSMEKEPAARYESAAAMAADLRALLERRSISVRPPGVARRGLRWARRHPGASLGVASLAALVVTMVVALLVTMQLARSRERAIVDLQAEQSARELELAVLLGRDLPRRMELLWPIVPERVEGPAGMDRWLADARGLLELLPRCRQQLDEVLTREVARADTEQAAVDGLRRWIDQARLGAERALARQREVPQKQAEQHARVAESWRERQAELEQQLEWRYPPRFEPPESIEAYRALAELQRDLPKLQPLIDEVQARRDFAIAVREQTVQRFTGQWAAIADELARDRSFDLVLKPQVGLVPLGRDPHSGLFEFGHPYSGTVPERDADGVLQIGPDTGLVFVLVPGGTFRMGAQRPGDEHRAGTANADPDAEQAWESPVHEVTLAPFLLSKYEMTQGQWQRCTGDNPSGYAVGQKAGGHVVTAQHPVERVSWWDCSRWCNRLGFRLPTEAQWEYAARAGTTTIWVSGNEPASLQGWANLADRHAKQTGQTTWRCEESIDDGHLVHAPVGSFRANAFGLHDVAGNVYEWCLDWLTTYEQPAIDDSGKRDGFSMTYRVVRSGPFSDVAKSQRVARRARFVADYVYVGLGFRPVWRLQP